MDYKKVGARLKALREDKGLSQEGIARVFNISTSSWTKYEQGIRTPSDEMKIEIAKFFETTVQAIFFEA